MRKRYRVTTAYKLGAIFSLCGMVLIVINACMYFLADGAPLWAWLVGLALTGLGVLLLDD